MEIISPQDVIDLLQQSSMRHGFLDVRSESEAIEAAIPGFINSPILNDQERHLVGTCYKQQGQDAAFALGYELTAPYKQSRVAQWSSLAKEQGLIVACWRGGARSRLACEWLQDAGTHTLRVRGGYKAMRTLLRARIDEAPPLLVLSGVTGCGKTALLRDLNVAKVDLEMHAHHRGSAFGGLGPQPRQQSFENALALDLWRGEHMRLIEDESRLIGRLELPLLFKTRMNQSPVVVLEASMEERVHYTHDEYVLLPLRQGESVQEVTQRLTAALDRITRKLGGLRHQQIRQCLIHAMQTPDDVNAHAEWIAPLLTGYYDPQYQFAFERAQRRVLMRGTRAELTPYIQEMLSESARLH